jgi:hypothetical protein
LFDRGLGLGFFFVLVLYSLKIFNLLIKIDYGKTTNDERKGRKP